MMCKNFALLSIGATLLLSLFFVDAGYAFQIVNRNPPADFLTVAEMYGWTKGPLQIVAILFGAGLIVLLGFGVRRIRHPHGPHAHGHQM
jgi:hypothetical protein